MGTIAATTDKEWLTVAKLIGENWWKFQINATGTGTIWPFKLYCGTHTTQLVLNIDGTVNVGNNLRIGDATNPTEILELALATEDLDFVDAGSSGATEQDWIEVKVGGNQGYIRVFATK
jgi:hypothetical protein